MELNATPVQAPETLIVGATPVAAVELNISELALVGGGTGAVIFP